MTLRRLNLKIQGFPESYASEPFGEEMVVGEPHQHATMSTISPLPAPQQSKQRQHGDVAEGTNGPGGMGDDGILGTA